MDQRPGTRWPHQPGSLSVKTACTQAVPRTGTPPGHTARPLACAGALTRTQGQKPSRQGQGIKNISNTAPRLWYIENVTLQKCNVSGLGGPTMKRRTSRAPQTGSGFSFVSRGARGTVSVLAVRVGHPRGCAGSFSRSANLHGLPPSLGGEGGRFENLLKRSQHHG